MQAPAPCCCALTCRSDACVMLRACLRSTSARSHVTWLSLLEHFGHTKERHFATSIQSNCKGCNSTMCDVIELWVLCTLCSTLCSMVNTQKSKKVNPESRYCFHHHHRRYSHPAPRPRGSSQQPQVWQQQPPPQQQAEREGPQALAASLPPGPPLPHCHHVSLTPRLFSAHPRAPCLPAAPAPCASRHQPSPL